MQTHNTQICYHQYSNCWSHYGMNYQQCNNHIEHYISQLSEWIKNDRALGRFWAWYLTYLKRSTLSGLTVEICPWYQFFVESKKRFSDTLKKGKHTWNLTQFHVFENKEFLKNEWPPHSLQSLHGEYTHTTSGLKIGFIHRWILVSTCTIYIPEPEQTSTDWVIQ